MGSGRSGAEQGGMERLASASGRFVKLPNSGWVELDTTAVQGAHEVMADMGVEAKSSPFRKKWGWEHVLYLG